MINRRYLGASVSVVAGCFPLMAATTAYAQQQPFVVVRSALPPCVEGAYRTTANGPCVCRSETPNFDSAHNRCIEPCVSGASWNRSRNECVCNAETPTYDSATRCCVIQPAPAAQPTIATRPSIESTVSWLNGRTRMEAATPASHLSYYSFFSREMVTLCGAANCGTLHYDVGNAYELSSALTIARTEFNNCTVRVQSSDSPDIHPFIETHPSENTYNYTVRLQQWIDFSLRDILSVEIEGENQIRLIARNSLRTIHYHLGMTGERTGQRGQPQAISDSSQVDRTSFTIFVAADMAPRVANAWRNLLSYCQSSSTSTPEPF